MTDADRPAACSRRQLLRSTTTLGMLVATGVTPGSTATTAESPERGFGAGGYGDGPYGGSTRSRVARFDRNGTPGIQRSEVLAAVEAYDRQERIDGRPVTADDVMAVLSAYNA